MILNFRVGSKVFLRWVLCCFLFLAGCANLPRLKPLTPFPTEHLPTLVAMTVEAGKLVNTKDASSLLPTGTPTAVEGLTRPTEPTVETTPPPAKPSATRPPATLPPATPTSQQPTSTPPLPSKTPTPLPTQTFPEAAIQIREPGALSRLVSPFTMRAYVKPGSDGQVRLELLGEDGRLLFRKVFKYAEGLSRVNIFEKIEFEISAVAEAARLQISTYDSYGRSLAFSSVDVVLLSMGEADVNPPGPSQEVIIVQEPLELKLIQGGKVFVAGLARTASDQPLLVELVAADGRLVGYRQASVAPDPQGGYGPFAVEVPYQVTAPTWVRMTISASSTSRIPGIVHLNSLELLLSP